MTRESLLARTLVELGDTLVDDFDVVDLLTLLADRCVELLDVQVAGIMLATPDGELRVMASSTEAMRILELFEIQAQEGPCFDCYHTGQAVVNQDLDAGSGRWPRFAAEALGAGFHSAHALPMRLRGAVIGVLNLFRTGVGEMGPADIEVAQAFGDVATIAILQHREAREAQQLAQQLTHALNSRVMLEQAKGMVAERLSLDMERAFAALRRHARNHNLRLSDVAQSLLDGSLAASGLDNLPPPDPDSHEARGSGSMESDHTEHALTLLVDAAVRVPPGDVLGLLDLMCDLLGARTARFHVADYSLRRLQEIDRNGRVGASRLITGTFLGRAFTSNEVLISGTDPTTLSVPLVEGTNRLGVLELDYDVWDGVLPKLFDPIIATFATTWVLKSRYSDVAERARRSEPLSAAAEVQWDLLPPLSSSTEQVGVSGILEPAYNIGGDSFDYAIDASRLDFAIVDAIGHGLPAVLMSAAAINSLRNSRRAESGVAAAYESADRSIATQFGRSYFVTAIIGSLDLRSGTLTWVNAGHALPMLVRNGTYAGALECKPSRPLGLGGPVVQVAEEVLQRGDRVLLYTDGITESRSPDGSFFGDDRLADFLVRASLEDLPVQETVRHISESVIRFNHYDLSDDATMLLLEWRGAT